MRTKIIPNLRFVVVIIAACLASVTRDCSAQGLEQMLIGNWELDIAATKKLGEKSTKAFAELGEFDVSLRYEFRQDGILALSVTGSENDSKDFGKWSVTKEDQQTKKLTIEFKSNTAEATEIMTLEFVEPKRVKVIQVKTDEESDAPFVLRRIIASKTK